MKTRIEKINSKLYQEKDKYLANKQKLEISNENLFCLLFEQIGLYIQEIDRLNSIVIKKCEIDLEVNIIIKKEQ